MRLDKNRPFTVYFKNGPYLAERTEKGGGEIKLPKNTISKSPKRVSAKSLVPASESFLMWFVNNRRTFVTVIPEEPLTKTATYLQYYFTISAFPFHFILKIQ